MYDVHMHTYNIYVLIYKWVLSMCMISIHIHQIGTQINRSEAKEAEVMVINSSLLAQYKVCIFIYS
jgi:hypothetical protein